MMCVYMMFSFPLGTTWTCTAQSSSVNIVQAVKCLQHLPTGKNKCENVHDRLSLCGFYRFTILGTFSSSAFKTNRQMKKKIK